MQKAKTCKSRILSAVMALVLCFGMCVPTVSWAAEANGGQFVIDPGNTGIQQDVIVNGEYRTVYCIQYDNIWPVPNDPAYHNSPTKYTEATADQLLLTDAQMATVRKLLFAGYPYNGIGALEPLDNLWGMGGYISANATQAAVWALMAEWKIPGNTHYTGGGLDVDPEDIPGFQEAYDAMMAYAKDPNTKIYDLPTGFTPQLQGNTGFTEQHGKWLTGALSISNPQNFKLRYQLTLPDGVVPVDANGDVDAFAEIDFFGDVTGYYIYGGETFYLQTSDVHAAQGKTVSFSATASIPTDPKQYVTNDTGLADKKDGQGYVQHPFQTMLSLGIASASYAGSATLEKHVDVAVSKEWVDGENQDGKRPSKVTIELLADGAATGKTLELSGHNDWQDEFKLLPAEKNGVAIKYTAREVMSDELVSANYTSAVTGDMTSGFKVTNTREVETVNVAGTKTWVVDATCPDQTRPTEVTVHLEADVAHVLEGVNTTAVATEATGWKYEFKDLPKYHKGEEIKYSVYEELVPNYVPTYGSETDPNNYDITNKCDHEHTVVQVAKVWDDEDNQDGIRPTSVTVYLTVDGVVDKNKTLTLDASNNWFGEFKGLPLTIVQDGVTKTPKYGVVEETEDLEKLGYSTNVSTKSLNSFEITNSHKPQTTSISLGKVWNDADNQDGDRPEQVVVKLFANGNHVRTATLTANDGWDASFDDLPVYENGEKIVYTVEEDPVEGYECTVAGDADTGFTVTNKHEPHMTKIAGTKVWEDRHNADGNRPDSIVLHLKDGDTEDANIVKTVTVKPDADGNWKFDFGELPTYANGEKIRYVVTEEKVDHYLSIYDEHDFLIVNLYQPEVIAFTVEKVWDDSSNVDKIRPESVSVELLRNGKKTGAVLVLNAANNWKGEFAELPSLYNKEKAVYTIEEVDVPKGYTVKIAGDVEKGFVVTNTHEVKEEPVKPDDPKKDDNGSSNGSIPKTGDNAMGFAFGFAGLMVASAAIAVVARRRSANK